MKKVLISAVLASAFLAGCQSVSPKTHAIQAAQQSKMERNKANVLAFYELGFNQYQLQKAADQYIGDVYLQHNPMVADGKAAFVQAMGAYIAKYPQSKGHIKRVLADGDLVMLHIHRQATPDSLGRAVVDIFRLDEHGKIVEHWDVAQDVPEKTVSGRPIF